MRWTGGVIAPYIATKVAEHINADAPCYLGAACCAEAVCGLVVRRRHLSTLDEVDIDHVCQDARLAPQS